MWARFLRTKSGLGYPHKRDLGYPHKRDLVIRISGTWVIRVKRDRHMINTWQDGVTLALIAVAVLYVVRRLMRLGKSSGCSSCATCDRGGGADKADGLISLECPEKRDEPL